jgi:putative oxidoreductase
MTLPSTARDALLLVARVLLGIVLIAHGWQKLAIYGLGGTAGSFAQMGVPLPAVSAVFAAVVELVGGAALLLGAATVVAGALVVLDMLGAFLLVHIGNGVFVTDGGFELVAPPPRRSCSSQSVRVASASTLAGAPPDRCRCPLT